MHVGIKNKIKTTIKKFPVLESYTKGIGLNLRYKVEVKLLKGTHINKNLHPSILHFSMNKAATQYIKRILITCGKDNGMTGVNMHDYAFNASMPFLDKISKTEMEKYQHIFKPKGYVYSVFGGMIEGIKNLSEYSILLTIRDPRDILVSEYYSMAYSHPLPSMKSGKYDNFMKLRNTAKKQTIDEYAVERCNVIHDVYDRYKRLLIDPKIDISILKYEEMTTDFESWFKKILNSCNLSISKDLFQNIMDENKQIKPKKENVNKHIRKGRAGDYKEKLNKETIDYLCEKFRSINKLFGYEQ